MHAQLSSNNKQLSPHQFAMSIKLLITTNEISNFNIFFSYGKISE